MIGSRAASKKTWTAADVLLQVLRVRIPAQLVPRRRRAAHGVRRRPGGGATSGTPSPRDERDLHPWMDGLEEASPTWWARRTG
ncbi:MAG: hypothetical protein MZU95_16755 [Desulfomicrobium escambiense]|nr:hypothetical protein [Desulfomicrobium escambiense]